MSYFVSLVDSLNRPLNKKDSKNFYVTLMRLLHGAQPTLKTLSVMYAIGEWTVVDGSTRVRGLNSPSYGVGLNASWGTWKCVDLAQIVVRLSHMRSSCTKSEGWQYFQMNCKAYLDCYIYISLPFDVFPMFPQHEVAKVGCFSILLRQIFQFMQMTLVFNVILKWNTNHRIPFSYFHPATLWSSLEWRSTIGRCAILVSLISPTWGVWNDNR